MGLGREIVASARLFLFRPVRCTLSHAVVRAAGHFCPRLWESDAMVYDENRNMLGEDAEKGKGG